MSNYQTAPLKLYIQDIFRAEITNTKYVYEMFDLTFKNVMIHGVVTSIYNTKKTTTNLELSDPTGSVQIYYDLTKSDMLTTNDVLQDLNRHFYEASRSRDENINIISTLMDRVAEKTSLKIDEGRYLSVIGDIFTDDKNTRMISAFECIVTSVERDLIWLEELRYLYEKFYLWKKE